MSRIQLPSFPTLPLRYLLLFATCLFLLASLAPGRAAFYPAAHARPYRDILVQSVPQYYYYHPSPDPGSGQGIEPPAYNSGRQRSAWLYGDRPVLELEGRPGRRSASQNVEVRGDSSPVMVSRWATRNSVSKTNAQAVLASPDYFDMGLESSRKRGPNSGRTFQGMPPFQPPPSSSVLPDLLPPNLFNWTGVIGVRAARAKDAPGHPDSRKGLPYNRRHRHKDLQLFGANYDKKRHIQDAFSQNKEKRVFETADLSLGGYDKKHAKAGRDSNSETDNRAYLASSYAAAVRNNRKPVVETADLSFGGYDRSRLMRDGRGKRSHKQSPGQVFNVMPPFQPPPSSSLLPDLFSPHAVNDSLGIIGQRPTRPSATNPRGAPSDPSHLSGDHPIHPSGGQGPQADPQGPRHEGQEDHRQADGQGLRDQYDRPVKHAAEIPEAVADGVWHAQRSETHLYSNPFASLPPGSYQKLPAPEYTEESGSPQEPIHARDVLVKIDSRRLQLTYRLNAPPYFTFEGLLAQLATYLMPGFCVDLAVTRRDQNCEIISHMAALQTDRTQIWLIEIVDTGGNIIWMDQCIPDTRLFIVLGSRVSFKFRTHSLVPSAILPVSTEEASPEGTGDTTPEEPRERTHASVGLPASDHAQVPQGPPLTPQRQTSENS
ncbi:uncharacterized protein LOC110978981 [Acanthaster planci]|uniref:Uncharacterized protein LOC110978981 n=1 Tax=Acanthaster planci TaxID=133434 RepID=A0A8B7YA19_ACAPL|nr:uncharacterized protein LOC110978981 [Acanthaster planci]XP_022090088.1 uncharacterized protein LOC110978981 [Acanthaster planci]